MRAYLHAQNNAPAPLAPGPLHDSRRRCNPKSTHAHTLARAPWRPVPLGQADSPLIHVDHEARRRRKPEQHTDHTRITSSRQSLVNTLDGRHKHSHHVAATEHIPRHHGLDQPDTQWRYRLENGLGRRASNTVSGEGQSQQFV